MKKIYFIFLKFLESIKIQTLFILLDIQNIF